MDDGPCICARVALYIYGSIHSSTIRLGYDYTCVFLSFSCISSLGKMPSAVYITSVLV